jgi:hypothetical protein
MPNAKRSVRAPLAPEQERGGHAERHRHDRLVEIALVLVLVQ